MANDNDIILGADDHNIAGDNRSWFESATDVVTGVPKFVVSAGASAINGFLNTGVAVGNKVGANWEEFNTQEQLAGLDSSLGDYYAEHKEGADIVGMVAGAFVPGTLAVKGLKMLQAAEATGTIGAGIARTTGLFANAEKGYLAKATDLIKNGSISGEVQAMKYKALANGFADEALQALAFEAGVAATMNQSPLLKDMDAEDLLWNATIGVGLGGVFGGGLRAIQSGGILKQAGKEFDAATAPIKFTGELNEIGKPGYSAADNVISMWNTTQKRTALVAEGVDEVTAKLAAKTEEASKLKMREHIQTISEDPALANHYTDMILGLKNQDDVVANLQYLRGLNKVGKGDEVNAGDVFYIHPNQADDGSATFSKIKGDGGNSQGYLIKGGDAELKVGNTHTHASREEAFADGVDIYYVKNPLTKKQSAIINPASKRVVAANKAADDTALYLDFETGRILQSAHQTFGDLAQGKKAIAFEDRIAVGAESVPVAKGTASVAKLSPLEASARYAHRASLGIKKAGLVDDVVIHEFDIPMLEQLPATRGIGLKFRLEMEDGTQVSMREATADYEGLIKAQKTKLGQKLLSEGVDADAVSIITNTPKLKELGEGNFMARQTLDDWLRPTSAKLDYDIEAAQQAGAVAESMGQWYARKNLIQDTIDTVASNFFKDMWEALPRFNVEDVRGANRHGVGASGFGFSNAAYEDVIGIKAQASGSFLAKLTTKLFEDTKARFHASAQKIATNEALSNEYANLWAYGLNSKHKYVINDDYTGIILKEARDFNLKESVKAAKDAKYVKKEFKAPDEFTDIERAVSSEVLDVLKNNLDANAGRRAHRAAMEAAKGNVSSKVIDNESIYWTPVNTADYPHFALVFEKGDELVGRETRPRMLFAPDAASLQKQIDALPAQYVARTKADTESFHRAMGDYEYTEAMNDLTFDNYMTRSGTASPFFVSTGKEGGTKLMNDLITWNQRHELLLARDMVGLTNSQAFAELKAMGSQYGNVATSKFIGYGKALEASAANPYTDYIKTALNISKSSEYSRWYDLNRWVDNGMSGAYRNIRGMFADKVDINDLASVERFNQATKEAGLGEVYTTVASTLYGNQLPNSPMLSAFVAKAQGMLSGTILGLDFFNAINNVVGMPILLSAQLNRYLKSPLLADLAHVKIPNGGGTQVSASKLIAGAMKDYTDDIAAGGKLVERYTKYGILQETALKQNQMMLGVLADGFNPAAGNLNALASKAYEYAEAGLEKGRKLTGNKHAEEMTRFVTARIVDKIGERLGWDERTIYAQMHALTNKVNGNMIASQRPIAFQGVIGQAVSLFQTYQFNLMQQLFRHVEEGDKKSAAILLGMQGSIYGLQGMPAFNALSTHIVGNAAGNSEHKDLYRATYDVAGQGFGDWLLYGAAANALVDTNIYTRGDINPRSLTILPNQIADIPLVKATTGFVGNLLDKAKMVADGGSFVDAVTQGLEHNGLNRPLAGLGAYLQGYSTTSKGLLISSIDQSNVFEAVRLFGAKPLDEAKSLDAIYRLNAYKAHDKALKDNLGQALKSQLVGNKEVDSETMDGFMADYIKAGGKQAGFNSWVIQNAKGANSSKVNQVRDALNKPGAQMLQTIMGGERLPDFNDPMPEAATE